VNKTARNWALWGLAGLGCAVPAAVGAAYQAIQTRKDDVRRPGLGERVDSGGRLVHVRRIGQENPGPTVVFQSGLSSPLETWGWVQPAVADNAPTLAYDRAGIGWSDAGPKPRTAARVSGELQRLLDMLDVSGPLVLVGHSYGGMLLRHFAQCHPTRVAGVVLVDASHPEQLKRSTRQRLGMPNMRANVDNNLLQARFGWSRLLGANPETELAGLGDVEHRAALARMISTRSWRTTGDEIDAWLDHVNDEVSGAKLPPDVPLFVLTSGETQQADPVHGELQRELAALSSRGVHQVLDGASHLGMLCSREHSRAVAAAVLEVVDAARTGRAPKPVELDPSQGDDDE
jgi:pimeloyl-ACP methyl ester carboxylesterase